jgi:hypothetical protein
MADTQTASATSNGSLPPTMLTPPTGGGLTSGLQPPTGATTAASLPTPLISTPLNPISTPTPQPTPTPTPPAAPAPPAPGATAPAAPAAPAAAPTYDLAVGDSLAAGMAQTRRFNENYDVHDEPAAKANPDVMAASGRTTDQTLAQINSNPQRYAGKGVILSSGISNDLMGGRSVDDAMTNVASQLDALSKAGAKVALVGVGSGVPGYQEANARLKQIADAYHIPFTGEPATTQGGRVHPKDYNAVFGQFNFGEQPQQPPGPAVTIDSLRGQVTKAEGGGYFTLYGHEGTSYQATGQGAISTKPGYYGFPDWAGGRGPDGRETHAAGGAQWEPDTWKKAVEGFTQAGLANQLGHTPDFRTPADQDAVFNYWLARRYREENPGHDIVEDGKAGHVNWASLGSEWSSLKNGLPGGGGNAGMTVSNLPGYQGWQRSIEEQRQTLEAESADLQKRMKDLEAGDPQQRALADQLLQKQIQLMDRYETMIAHPPTQKPADVLGNFGSIATLIGIFAGRFAHRPMVASLNAAGAAMQAMNNNDYEAYKNAFNTWKIQTDMTQNLISMESSTYKNIMDDKRLTMDEKFKEMDAAAKIYQNRLLGQQLEAGEYEKAWDYAQKLGDAKDAKARNDAEIEHLHAETEKTQAEAQQKTQWGELAGETEEEKGARAYLEAKHQKLEQEAKEKGLPDPPSVAEMAKNPAEVQEALNAARIKPAAEKASEPKPYTVTSPDGTQQEKKNLSWMGTERQWLDADTGKVFTPPTDPKTGKPWQVAPVTRGSADKASEPKPYIITSPDGKQQEEKNLAWMGNERQWWDADANKVYTPPVDPATGKQWQVQPKPHEGVFAQNINQRLEIAANDVSKTMVAMTALPMGTTLGMFGGAQAALGGGPAENFRKALLNTATPLQTQLLTTLSNGLARSLATLAAGGVATGLVGLADQMQKDVPQAGDKGLNILMRFADMRQIADAATEILATNPQLNETQRQKVLEMQEQIHKAIPYSTYDIVVLAGTGTPSTQSVSQFSRRIGAGVPTLTKQQFDDGVKSGTLHPGDSFRKPGDPTTYTVPGP